MKFRVEKVSLQPPKKCLPMPAYVVGQKALDDLEKTWGQIFQTMKNRYPGWEVTLAPDLEKFQTKRVFFNPKTGQSWPVKGWKDYLDFFDLRYWGYPFENDYVNYFAEGVWKFSVSIDLTEWEPWFRFVLQGPERSDEEREQAIRREKPVIPRNSFHQDIWQHFECAPNDPEFAFLRNMHKILPQGFRVQSLGDADDDKMQFLVANENFDECVAMGPTFASLEVGFPFPAPSREILEFKPRLPIWPLDVREFAGEWFWRVKILPL